MKIVEINLRGIINSCFERVVIRRGTLIIVISGRVIDLARARSS